MKKSDKITVAIAILLVAAFVIMLEQFVSWGTWWSWDQVLHHENFALVLASVAIGMAISKWR